MRHSRSGDTSGVAAEIVVRADGLSEADAQAVRPSLDAVIACLGGEPAAMHAYDTQASWRHARPAGSTGGTTLKASSRSHTLDTCLNDALGALEWSPSEHALDVLVEVTARRTAP